MNTSDHHKQLPNSGNHRCFGCSAANEHGLQMQFFTDEKAVFSHLTIPDHLCGWSQIVHGGVLSTILDEIMSWTAIYFLKRITMTRSMSVDFHKAVSVNDEVTAEGRVVELQGKREAIIEGKITNAEAEVCATSTGTFWVFSPAVAKRLGIADDESLQWFESIYQLK